MRDTTTDELVRSLVVSVELRVRAEDILKLQKTGRNASQLKARQRDERKALTALNRHLKECLREHKRQVNNLLTVGEARKKAKLKRAPDKHLYTPTRRGLRRVNG